MIIFDDFLPNSNLRLDLTKDSFWAKMINGLQMTWCDRNKDPSNPIEELSKIVWNEVVGIKQNIDGWEYWAHHLTADGHQELDFHYDTDLMNGVSKDEEEILIQKGEIRTADNAFIYYAHRSLPDGGYLEIKNRNDEVERIEPVPNRLIVFDPKEQHRVTKVTSGARYSLLSNLWHERPKYHLK